MSTKPETITVWKVLTHKRRSAWVSDIPGVGREYPVGVWVRRNTRLGPLMAFRTWERASRFARVAAGIVVRADAAPSPRQEFTIAKFPPERDLIKAELMQFWRGTGTLQSKTPLFDTIFCNAIRCVE